MASKLSLVARSNLFTMGCAAKLDPRQTIPPASTIPGEDVRLLRARLILEEALETAKALGVTCSVACAASNDDDDEDEDTDKPACVLSMDSIDFSVSSDQNDVDPLEVIDGACDTIYVCVGTLCAFGVPDLPHLEEVCKRNNAKFPNGEATTDIAGKFQKPEGWVGPDHGQVLHDAAMDLAAVAQALIAGADANAADPDGLAELAYNAHREFYHSQSGLPRLHKWTDQPAPVKAAWDAAAAAILKAVQV